MKTCVIIPTLNESKMIAKLVGSIRAQNLDVIVIDDGSIDNTSVHAAGAGAKVFKNERNLGKGASLLRGFEFALKDGYSAIITMDGDGQHLPEDIPFFLRIAANSPKHIFVGNRMHKTRNMPIVRLATNKFMSWVISGVARQKIPDTQCGFRLIKREVLEKVKLSTRKYETESELLIKASRQGFKIEAVSIKTVYQGEKSQINPLVDTARFLRFMFKEVWTITY